MAKIKIPKRKVKAVDVNSMTDKEQLFIKEYPIDLNPKQAAIRAGFGPTNASKQAENMLKRPRIVQAIRVELANRAQKTELDAQKVLYELALLAFADPGDMFDESGCLLHIKDMPPAIRKCLAGFDVQTRESRDGSMTTIAKVKFWNKLEALVAIGKHLGIMGSTVENKHLHLHSVVTNPYLNAPDEAILEAKSALTRLEHSVRSTIMEDSSNE